MNSNNSNIKKRVADDGTVDDDYTWGRPVTTYLSPHQHIRIVAIKSRLEATAALDEPRVSGAPGAPG
jgi:hypothetical protein